jgi:hypothetical protein
MLKLAIACSLLLVGCDTGDPGGGDPDGGSPGDADPIPADSPKVTLSGQVVDFETGQPVSGAATVVLSGIMPAPKVTVTGADFVVEAVPANSVVVLLAGSPPDYRSTYNTPLVVQGSDRTDLRASTLKESYIANLQQTFQATLQPGRGIVIARLVDVAGKEVAGVPSAQVTLAGSKGPYVLDAQKRPAPQAAASSASGYLVFFDVAAGVVDIRPAQGSMWTFAPTAAKAAANVITLVDVIAQQGNVVAPKNVSFSQQVVPIFMRRGCIACHSGGGPGKDLGDLHLDGSADHIYREVATDISPNHQTARVNRQAPEKSLLLTMPGFEVPADKHPTATFATTADADYQLILAWIKEGAIKN